MLVARSIFLYVLLAANKFTAVAVSNHD